MKQVEHVAIEVKAVDIKVVLPLLRRVFDCVTHEELLKLYASMTTQELDQLHSMYIYDSATQPHPFKIGAKMMHDVLCPILKQRKADDQQRAMQALNN